jgi:hypothetical protein
MTDKKRFPYSGGAQTAVQSSGTDVIARALNWLRHRS